MLIVLHEVTVPLMMVACTATLAVVVVVVVEGAVIVAT